MASCHAGPRKQRLVSCPASASGDWICARRRSRCVHSFNPRCKTRGRSGGVSSSSSCSCRLSASNVLKLFQPAAGCWALETVLAMAQPVRVHDGTCSRCAAALLRPMSPRLLEVCRTPRRSPPAMHRSQSSDRVSCARAAGSCSVSSSIIGLTVGDRRHAWRRAGRARCTQHVHAAVESKRRRCAMAGHVRTASSRCPAAAGITHPHHRLAWTCL